MTKAKFIPQEITEDILIRLPATSLSRFKAVCRSWCSLISHPPFIHLHSQRVSQHPKILFTTDALQFQLLDIASPSFDESCLSPPLDFPASTPDNFVKILGSSCGLVCVVVGHRPPVRHLDYPDAFTDNKFFLWNPSTRESRKIPDMSPWHWLRVNGHGFGYDPVSDDLKLVVADRGFAETFDVFSVKSNSWKSVTCPGDRRLALINETQATVVNGVFHWLDKRPWPPRHEIIAFDSKEDRRLNLRSPVDSSSASLLKHEERLCVCVHHSRDTIGQIWMLKGHRWVHYLTVSPTCRPGPEIYLRAMCMSKSSTQITFCGDKGLFVRLRKEDPLKFEKFPSTILRGATMYVETLLSPNHVQFIGCTDTN